MTVIEALKALNAYPVPSVTLKSIAEAEGFLPDSELTLEERNGKGFRRATAAIYRWLSAAPTVVQNGVQFSFTDADRKRFAQKAASILDALDETDEEEYECGYVGEDF